MKKDHKNQTLRVLPAVDRLLNVPSLKELSREIPRSELLAAARQVLDGLRADLQEGLAAASNISLESIAAEVEAEALRRAMPSLRPAINATGVVLHTGLGRAVLPDAARQAIAAVASGHSVLELDVESGERGSRSIHYRDLLAGLCDAESGLAVNNNAAAVLLALNTLAAGKEVIVSRGQLVEIGGSFRMPDVMARAGAQLVEVGTTNRTRISDYEHAISEQTSLILRVKTSNFRIVGFTEETPLSQLVELGGKQGIPVMEDLGSGAMMDMAQFGLSGEAAVQESVRAGADIVTFSGDKLLGGPQAGLIVGRREPIDAMAGNPLARALRLGKLSIAGLESTLRLYLDPKAAISRIPTLRSITRPTTEIHRAARRLKKEIESQVGAHVRVEIADGFSEVGGGSLPGEQLPTKLVAISTSEMRPDEIARLFRESEAPIFGRVGHDRFLLDLRTVSDTELREIARAASRIFSERSSAN